MKDSKEIYRDGIILCKRGDLLHCEDGPAVVFKNGTKKWFINGKKHREDGPAIEWSNGNMVWCLYDHEYSEQKFIEWKLLNLLT